jgi:Leucine-rich repeat (LRR) protein
LSKLGKLSFLDVSFNKIKSPSMFYKFKKLKYLYLSMKNYQNAQKLKKALPYCSITFKTLPKQP